MVEGAVGSGPVSAFWRMAIAGLRLVLLGIWGAGRSVD